MRYVERGGRRGGFTLVELMVVILIIVLLIGLVGAGILKYASLGPQVQTTNEINQLAVALEAFKLKYKVYPPSSFALNGSDGWASAIWPRITPAALASLGNGTLTGDQSIVFFLQGPTGQGFSTNQTGPLGPFAPPSSAQESRGGPFFTFPANRLTQAPTLGVYPSFKDPYATPLKFNVYAYFSSGRTTNGYTPTDCANLGVAPYFQLGAGAAGTAIPKYYNASTFQIISAGADFVFGPGGNPLAAPNSTPTTCGVWPSPGGQPWMNAKYYDTCTGNANAWPNPNGLIGNGFDDLSNFAGGFLGVGQ